MQREDDFFREHGSEPESLARGQLLDLATGRALPSRARLQLGAGGLVERDVEHAVKIVLGIDAALGGQAFDDGVEGALAGQREIEEHAGLVRFGLRADESRRRPRSFKTETAALEDGDLDAIGGEPPRD